MSYCVYQVVPPPALQHAITAEWRLTQERACCFLSTKPVFPHTKVWKAAAVVDYSIYLVHGVLHVKTLRLPSCFVSPISPRNIGVEYSCKLLVKRERAEDVQHFRCAVLTAPCFDAAQHSPGEKASCIHRKRKRTLQWDGNVIAKTETKSISVLVRMIHQVLHLDLLPAGLVPTMTHAACVLLPESSWDISLTATPCGADLISQARRERECGQNQYEECGQPDHCK